MKFILANIALFLIFITPCDSLACSKVNNNKGHVVVVMDIQKHFMEKKISDQESELLINKINRFQDKIKEKADMVYIQSILTVLSVSPGGVDIDTLDGLGFDIRLDIKTENCYKKDKANAFTSNNFVDFLKKKAIGTLYIVGVMAEHCIYKTACNALKRGYKVVLVKDAIQGRNKVSMDKILAKLMEKGAEVKNVDEI